MIKYILVLGVLLGSLGCEDDQTLLHATRNSVASLQEEVGDLVRSVKQLKLRQKLLENQEVLITMCSAYAISRKEESWYLETMNNNVGCVVSGTFYTLEENVRELCQTRPRQEE